MPNVIEVKWLGQGFYQRLGKATRCLKTSREKLDKLKEKGVNNEAIKIQEQNVKQDEAELYKIEQGQQTYSDPISFVEIKKQTMTTLESQKFDH